MADLNHVALFARVVQAGSFSGAARALGLPKATVSRNVARLEADIGARLLHRTTRKLELTALGRTYYEETSRGLTHLDAARERIAAAQSEPTGTLRVTAPVYFGIRYLIDWVAEFLAMHQKVNIELRLTDDFVDLVEDRIDLALRTGRLASSSFIARRLGTTRRILLASPNYLQKHGEPLQIDDLLKHSCVIFGRSLAHPVWCLEGPSGVEEIHVLGRIAVDSAHAALSAVVAGAGIALLPSGPAIDDLHAGRLRHVLANYGVDGGGLYAVYPSNRQLSAAVREFLDFVVARVQSVPTWDHPQSPG